jgi:hypothetical protein
MVTLYVNVVHPLTQPGDTFSMTTFFDNYRWKRNHFREARKTASSIGHIRVILSQRSALGPAEARLFSVYVIKWYGEVKLQHHFFLTWAQNGGECLRSRYGEFTFWIGNLESYKSRSRPFGNINISALPGIEKQSSVIHPISKPYSDYIVCPIEYFFSIVQQPLVDQGFFTDQASQSHSIRHTTLGRTPLDEWSACSRDLYLTTQTLYKTNIHAVGWIRTCISCKRAAADPNLTPRSHWDVRFYKWHYVQLQTLFVNLQSGWK